MGGLIGGAKPDDRAAKRAEAASKEAEQKALAADRQAKIDDEYRRTKQRGKSTTILSNVDDSSTSTRSFLGG